MNLNLSYTPKDAVIDTVAIMLILFPEPATTALGIAIMARPRGGKKKQATRNVPRRYPSYIYRVDNIRGREITWEAKVVMPGQLSLQRSNRANVNIKRRENLIISQTAGYQQTGQTTMTKLPPGVKVHHTIRRPVNEAQNIRKTGTEPVIHHTLREMPQQNNRKQSTGGYTIHHTIENSPGYIRAQSDRRPQQKTNIIHHTLKNAPGAQLNNPIRIEKPTIIVKHHTLNRNPAIPEPLIPRVPSSRRRSLDSSKR
ncbi:MAG: hypothetical protein PHI59_08000 [Candidatus Omnitrophica bacterium]|nr:hypothetical protein [Candidatus Omnitrophota bacterium]